MAEVAEDKREIIEDALLGISVLTILEVLQLLRIVTAIHARSDLT
jgi:hypothetical protein